MTTSITEPTYTSTIDHDASCTVLKNFILKNLPTHRLAGFLLLPGDSLPHSELSILDDDFLRTIDDILQIRDVFPEDLRIITLTNPLTHAHRPTLLWNHVALIEYYPTFILDTSAHIWRTHLSQCSSDWKLQSQVRVSAIRSQQLRTHDGPEFRTIETMTFSEYCDRTGTEPVPHAWTRRSGTTRALNDSIIYKGADPDAKTNIGTRSAPEMIKYI
jgi:hypothetical protein